VIDGDLRFPSQVVNPMCPISTRPNPVRNDCSKPSIFPCPTEKSISVMKRIYSNPSLNWFSTTSTCNGGCSKSMIISMDRASPIVIFFNISRVAVLFEQKGFNGRIERLRYAGRPSRALDGLEMRVERFLFRRVPSRRLSLNCLIFSISTPSLSIQLNLLLGKRIYEYF
jgi:hypothetical protein